MLEHLFPHSWIKGKAWLMLFLGFAFSVVGMGSALILFPGDAAFPAIAFTALLALPSLNRMLALESKEAASEQIVRLFARAGWDHRLIERVIKVKLSELAGERHRIENSLHMHHAMHKQYN